MLKKSNKLKKALKELEEETKESLRHVLFANKSEYMENVYVYGKRNN